VAAAKDGIAAAALHNYYLKKVITKFAVKNAGLHAAVFESGDAIHRGRDRFGPAFPVILFLREPFADPFDVAQPAQR
jgi:hypothetical protein